MALTCRCKHSTTKARVKGACRHLLEDGRCVLNIVEDRGPMSGPEVAEVLGLSRQRIDQIVDEAMIQFLSAWVDLYGVPMFGDDQNEHAGGRVPGPCDDRASEMEEIG